jgi:hypothetical protein
LKRFITIKTMMRRGKKSPGVVTHAHCGTTRWKNDSLIYLIEYCQIGVRINKDDIYMKAMYKEFNQGKLV